MPVETDPNKIAVAFNEDTAGNQPQYQQPNTAAGTFEGTEAPRALQEQAAARQAAAVAPKSTFSVDDIEAARQAEKDKLYPRIDEQLAKLTALETQLATFTQEREAEQAAKEAAAEADAEAARLAREDDMSAKDQVREVEARLRQEIASEREERERAEALLAKEREFASILEYRSQRLQAEDVRESIAPQLLDYVSGSTQEEIEQSIARAQQTTANILAEVQRQQATAYQQMPGVSPRAPGVGPMEQGATTQDYSAKDIKDMSMADYQKRRTPLIDAASKSYKANVG